MKIADLEKAKEIQRGLDNVQALLDYDGPYPTAEVLEHVIGPSFLKIREHYKENVKEALLNRKTELEKEFDSL